MAADDLPSNTEVVVVGAGIIGGAVACRLARAGRRIALIDPDPQRAAGSATVASGAMLGVLGEVTFDDPEPLRFRVAADAAYAEWLAELDGTAGLATELRRGTFVVASARRASDVRALREIEHAAATTGRGCERVEPEDVPGLAPTDGFWPARVVHLPDEGWVDAPVLRERLVAATAEAGAQVIAGEVARLVEEGGAVRGVVLGCGRRIDAEHVVVCTGPDVPVLLASSGLTGLLPSLVHAKGVSVTLDRRGDAVGVGLSAALRTPNRAFACGLHVVPRADGRVYVGATNRVSRVPSVLGAATGGEVAMLLSQAFRELNSGLADWDIGRVAHGYRALSVDGRAVVGPTDIEGLSVATGCYRDGVLLAPAVARIVQEGLDGCHHPFTTPLRAPAAVSPVDVLQAGAADLAELIHDPDDPAWGDRLERLLLALGTMALQPGDPRAAHLVGLLTALPVTEMLPEAVIEILQETPVQAPKLRLQDDPATTSKRSFQE